MKTTLKKELLSFDEVKQHLTQYVFKGLGIRQARADLISKIGRISFGQYQTKIAEYLRNCKHGRSGNKLKKFIKTQGGPKQTCKCFGNKLCGCKKMSNLKDRIRLKKQKRIITKLKSKLTQKTVVNRRFMIFINDTYYIEKFINKLDIVGIDPFDKDSMNSITYQRYIKFFDGLNVDPIVFLFKFAIYKYCGSNYLSLRNLFKINESGLFAQKGIYNEVNPEIPPINFPLGTPLLFNQTSLRVQLAQLEYFHCFYSEKPKPLDMNIFYTGIGLHLNNYEPAFDCWMRLDKLPALLTETLDLFQEGSEENLEITRRVDQVTQTEEVHVQGIKKVEEYQEQTVEMLEEPNTWQTSTTASSAGGMFFQLDRSNSTAFQTECKDNGEQNDGQITPFIVAFRSLDS